MRECADADGLPSFRAFAKRALSAIGHAKQTLFTLAAVPVGIAVDPLLSKYLRICHGVYVYRYLAPAAPAAFL
ncbi:MAG: hypothetical protein HBSAPP03_25780 [Phycisphaerae bacterium]|nr:MAG: hypothetical protein HBSAPP03_25780 [Phycisphaerae bacterium]